MTCAITTTWKRRDQLLSNLIYAYCAALSCLTSKYGRHSARQEKKRTDMPHTPAFTHTTALCALHTPFTPLPILPFHHVCLHILYLSSHRYRWWAGGGGVVTHMPVCCATAHHPTICMGRRWQWPHTCLHLLPSHFGGRPACLAGQGQDLSSVSSSMSEKPLRNEGLCKDRQMMHGWAGQCRANWLSLFY